MEFHSTTLKRVPRYSYAERNGPRNWRRRILHGTKSRIECSFEEIGVWEGGYQALSYVWGDPEKPFKAFVLDSEGNEVGYIPLTRSLKVALQDLRDTLEIEQKVFWIDQICINQEGSEKNHQVALMGQIYRNASRVITYIGTAFEDDEEEKRGIALLQRLDKHFADNHELLFEVGGPLFAILR